MILSKREHYIVVTAIAALALLVADRYVLTPILSHRARMETKIQSLTGEKERAATLFSRKSLMTRKWNEMIAGGLKTDPAEAESQVLHAMRDWAQEAGLTLWSMKPERLHREDDLREIMFQAAATGPMSAVSRFLWRIETTSIPLRVKEVQLSSRREGTDALSLQLRVSTLYLSAEHLGTEKDAQPTPGEETL